MWLLKWWRWFLWLRLPPAEAVKHPEEGDHHIDKDDKGEQGVRDVRVWAVPEQLVNRLFSFFVCNNELTCNQEPQ